MKPLEYTEVELPFIEQLQSYGYTYIKGSELDAERNGRGSIVLEGYLAKAIRRLNKWISEVNIEKVVKQLVTLQSEDLWDANKTLFDWLFGQGISILQDLGSGKKIIRYVYSILKIFIIMIFWLSTKFPISMQME
ncbi:hypothetical protein [Bacillus cereus group sp. BfR-BA-01349]|uniref:hypothetical protein n=1 Tax=Bacillus cereus group sp. BfR-BA-01349 TaxID=2920312 RepID=UPI001F5AF427